ncbi:peptide ABC transporter permease, partial [Rhizobium sp. BUS002]|nr:peptide ABC transporter permease [Rhizobium phaseoli]
LLPERMRLSSLYLLPIGLALAAATAMVLSFTQGTAMMAGAEADSFTLARASITLVVLVWPAMAALWPRGRWLSASALAVGVVAAAIATHAP